MLKRETIAKYVREVNALKAEMLTKVGSLHVCISKGNVKIGRCMNVSLAPIFTCGGACRVCCGICYDMKACLQYGNVLNARVRNYVLAMYDRNRFFAEIDVAMNRRRKNKAMRWHVGGDMLDVDYFSRIVDNARRHPDFVIWTYTKRYEIINEYVRTHGGSIAKALPDNLSIMFSVWDGLECVNPYGFATFECVLDGHEWPAGIHHCPGNCDICLQSGTGCPARQSSAVGQH